MLSFLVCLTSWAGRVHYVDEGAGAATLTDIAGNTTEVRFVLSLRQRNLPELRRMALAVSTPSHPQYGKYLAQSQLDALTSPSVADVRAVSDWLRTEQGVSYEVERELVRVQTTVERATTLLQTRFAWRAIHESGPLLRATDFSLPARVAQAVACVFGLHGLPLPERPPLRGSGALAARKAVKITPAVLATTYRLGSPLVNRTSSRNRQAVAEFQRRFMKKADLKDFFSTLVPKARAGDELVSKFVGSAYHEGASTEAALDVQYLMGVAPGVSSEFWEWAGSDFCADLHGYTDALLSSVEAPHVNSISYGWQGPLSELGCSAANAAVVDTNFAKLAARGVTMVFASGDEGSGYRAPSCDGDAQFQRGVVVSDGDVQMNIPHVSLADCCADGDAFGGQAWTWVEDTPPGDDGEGRGVVTPPTGADDGATAGGVNAAGPSALSNRTHNYTYYAGFVYEGEDLYNGSFTFEEARARCDAEPLCKAFSYHNATRASTTPHNTYLKRTTRRGPDPTWTTYLKDFVPPPPTGSCTVYSAVRKVAPAAPGSTAVSGILSVANISLYPSWPASSPWVTAVGATRFIHEKEGAGEMASDSFGSGVASHSNP